MSILKSTLVQEFYIRYELWLQRGILARDIRDGALRLNRIKSYIKVDIIDVTELRGLQEIKPPSIFTRLKYTVIQQIKLSFQNLGAVGIFVTTIRLALLM